jgi:hypothetical protein
MTWQCAQIGDVTLMLIIDDNTRAFAGFTINNPSHRTVAYTVRRLDALGNVLGTWGPAQTTLAALTLTNGTPANTGGATTPTAPGNSGFPAAISLAVS